MTQTTHHFRSGWQQDEINLLFESVAQATSDGLPLRNVFDTVGEKLQRKPNSIRNFYYAKVRQAPDLAQRQSSFRAFDEEELLFLLREVLQGRGRGESVRACVMRLAGGDRSGMLRYQNKYRSILKNKPDLLLCVAEELRAQGLPCPQDVLACRAYGQHTPPQPQPIIPPEPEEPPLFSPLTPYMQNETVCTLVNCLSQLLNENQNMGVPYQKWAQAQREVDRLRVEVDLLRMALEDANEHRDHESTQEDPSTWV